jgi:hypothetical protein
MCGARPHHFEEIIDVNGVNHISGSVVLYIGEYALVPLHSVNSKTCANSFTVADLTPHTHRVHFYKRTNIPKYWKCIKGIYMNLNHYAENAIANHYRNVPISFYSFIACQESGRFYINRLRFHLLYPSHRRLAQVVLNQLAPAVAMLQQHVLQHDALRYQVLDHL